MGGRRTSDVALVFEPREPLGGPEGYNHDRNRTAAFYACQFPEADSDFLLDVVGLEYCYYCPGCMLALMAHAKATPYEVFISGTHAMEQWGWPAEMRSWELVERLDELLKELTNVPKHSQHQYHDDQHDK